MLMYVFVLARMLAWHEFWSFAFDWSESRSGVSVSVFMCMCLYVYVSVSFKWSVAFMCLLVSSGDVTDLYVTDLYVC